MRILDLWTKVWYDNEMSLPDFELLDTPCNCSINIIIA